MIRDGLRYDFDHREIRKNCTLPLTQIKTKSAVNHSLRSQFNSKLPTGHCGLPCGSKKSWAIKPTSRKAPWLDWHCWTISLMAPSPHYAGLPEMLAVAERLKLNFPKEFKIFAVEVEDPCTSAEGPLRQAFQMLAGNTPLQGAELVIDEFSVKHTCETCHHAYVTSAEDLLGHLFFCPDCGRPAEIDEAHGLELVSMTIERPRKTKETNC
jgi:Zn finger protein HypA/HybF involved in hydrogenase expression